MKKNHIINHRASIETNFSRTPTCKIVEYSRPVYKQIYLVLESDRSFVSVIEDRHIGEIFQHRLSARADCR